MGDKYWTAVAGKLRKVRKIWTRMTRILSREGEEPKVLGSLFKEVVQAVLLFGAEKLVLTPWMEWALRRFQSRVAQRITGRQPR